MLRKPKILVVGSFMMDLIATAARVPNMGETVIGSGFSTAPGGKGVNQAVQCARLGAEVTMAGCVGKDAFGSELLEAARAAGIDVSHVKISEQSSSGVGNIQLEKTEQGVQNRILVVPGANYDLGVSDLEWLETGVGGFDMVMLQLELTMEATKYAARCAHRAGVPVMLNPAPAAPLDADLLRCVTYLSPNEHEAALLSGIPVQIDGAGAWKAELERVTEALRAWGIQKVLVTLGDQGAVLADDGGLYHTPCVKMPEVRDPTAAGDSFVAAFCTGITAGLTEREALALASHTAAITVSGAGAIPSLPTVDMVQALMARRGCAEFDPSRLDALKN